METSAAYRLFHYRYMVRLPYIYLFDPSYAEDVGYHISGNGQLDNDRLYQYELVKRLPAGLAILFDQGARFDFTRPEDVVSVYTDIQEHLTDWKNAVVYDNLSLGVLPPLEEFRQFEALAEYLYNTAMFYRPMDEGYSKLKAFLMQMNERRNPGAEEQRIRAKIFDGTTVIKPYVSIVDEIETVLLEDYHGH